MNAPQNHSPLPWDDELSKRRICFDVVAHDGSWVAACFPLANISHEPTPEDFARAEANAALIVRAVNSHAALVTVLQSFPGFTDDAAVGDAWVERVRAALATATKP